MLQKMLFNGKEEVIEKIKVAVNQLLPESLKEGEYKAFGAIIIQSQKEFIPLLSSSYEASDANKRRIKNVIKDITDTVAYCVKKCENDEKDEKDEELINETLEILNSKIEYTKGFSKNFTFIATSPTIKKAVHESKITVKKITEFLGGNLDAITLQTELNKIIGKYLYKGEESILDNIFNIENYNASNPDHQFLVYNSELNYDNYIKILRKTVIHILKKNDFTFKSLDTDLFQFLNYGIITPSLWMKYVDASKEKREDILPKVERLIPLFNYTPPTKIRLNNKSIPIPCMTVIDWIKGEVGKMIAAPFMAMTRQALIMDRNLIIRIHRELESIRGDLKNIYKDHANGNVLEKSIMDYEQTLIKGSKVDLKQKLKDVALQIFPERGRYFCISIDQLYIYHKLLQVIEKEITTTLNAYENKYKLVKDKAVELLDKNYDFDSLHESVTNLFSQIRLSVKNDSVQNIEYSPIFKDKTSPMKIKHVAEDFESIFQIFPDFETPKEVIYEKPKPQSIEEYFADFSIEDFAGKLKNIRLKLRQSEEVYTGSKIILFPGSGSGTYIASDKLFLAPSFFEKSNFVCQNLIGAISNYVHETRHSLFEKHSLSILVKEMKSAGIVDENFDEKDTVQAMIEALKKIKNSNRMSPQTMLIKDLLDIYFSKCPVEDIKSEENLDDELFSLVDEVTN